MSLAIAGHIKYQAAFGDGKDKLVWLAICPYPKVDRPRGVFLSALVQLAHSRCRAVRAFVGAIGGEAASRLRQHSHRIFPEIWPPNSPRQNGERPPALVVRVAANPVVVMCQNVSIAVRIRGALRLAAFALRELQPNIALLLPRPIVGLPL